MARGLVFIFFLMGFFSLGQEVTEQMLQGNEAYEKGDYFKAQIRYEEAKDKKVKSNYLIYNLGSSYYQQNKFEEATTTYKEFLQKASNPKEKAKVFYGMGNSYFREKKYQESVENYKKAMIEDPEDQDILHNYLVAKRFLDQQQKNKNDEKQDKKNKNQDSKDQNDSDKKKNEDKKNSKDQNKKRENTPEQKKTNQREQQQKMEAQQMLKNIDKDKEAILRKMIKNKMKEQAGSSVESDKDW